MFEILAQKILKGIIGQYVEDFNSENLNIGLWRGEVTIQNVRLKSNVIQKFNVPFNVKYSRLGSLRMNIPWSSLSTSKIQVQLQGLQLLLTEIPQQKWQCKDHKIIQKRKKQVQAYCDSIIEQFAKKASQSAKQLAEKKQGYFANMLVKIIDNMQVVVKNIHVRFQDQIGGCFSFGVTLEELKIYTVNKVGEPEFVDRTKKQYQNQPLRKKLILANLGVYWNQKSQFFKSDPHKQMMDTISRTNQKQNKMNYLLLLSSSAMLYLRQPGKQFTDPEINLLIQFNQLKVRLANQQLQQIVTLGEKLQKYSNQVKAQNRKKLTQLEMISNREIFMKLFPKYFQKKCNEKEMKVIQDILQKMQTSNFEQSIKCYLQQKQKQKMIQQKIKQSQGWFSAPKQLTQQQVQQIQKYLMQNFGTEYKPIKRPQNFYYIRINFNLKQLQLTIANQLENRIEEGIRFRFCQIRMEFCLREDGYLGNFCIRDVCCELFRRSYLRPEIQEIINVVQRIRKEELGRDRDRDYVRVQIFGNPLHKRHLNQEIVVRTEELLIQFHPKILKIGQQFADIKLSSQNKEAALQAYGQIKNKATNVANELKKPFQKKSFISIDVKINAISLLLFFNPAQTLGDVWVVKIGQIQVYSDPQILKKLQFNYDQPMQRYGLSFSKLSFTHFPNKSSYFDSRSKNLQINSNDKVIYDLGIDFWLELFNSTLDTIPKIKITTVLHNIDIYLNQFTYGSIQKIGQCFSMPVEQNLRDMEEKEKMLTKTAIMKQAKKIGIVYEQSKSLKKYIGVLAGSYLYLFKDKKDVEYTAYYYLKNCEIIYNNQTQPDKKMLQVKFKNAVNQLVLGFEKPQPMQQWVKAIKNIDNTEKQQYKDKIEQNKAPKPQPPNPPNPKKLNFQLHASIEQVTISTQLPDKKSIEILINSLDTKTKIYESKTTLNISLRSIQLSDNIYLYKYKELNNLLYSAAIQGKEKLIEIGVINCDRAAEDQAGVKVNVDFGRLICNYKPETVERLMNFYLPKDGEFAARRKQKGEQLTKEQKDQIQAERKLRKRQHIQNDIKKGLKQQFTFQIHLKIEQISASLVNRNNKVMFARIGLSGFNYKLAISSRRIVMNGSLQEMWFGDYSCYPDTIYEEKEKYLHVDYIIQSNNGSRDMLMFSVELREMPDENGKTLFVKTEIYDVKASYIQQPVLRVITYLLDQVLPSLTPPQDLSQVKQVPKNDIKPSLSTMVLIANAQNVLAFVEPRCRQQQYLQLNVSKISVTNTSIYRDYIKIKQNQDDKVLVENYSIKMQGINILQKFRGQEVKLTNDLNFSVSCDLIQNAPYYRKVYKERFDPGMRIQCELSPFVMCLNHDDYNFIMKCLYWNITYDDNAEGYFFSPPILRQSLQNTQSVSEPIHFGLSMQKIILCVTENNFPLSVLLLNQMRYDLTLDDTGMYMVFKMKHFSGTTIQKTQDQKISLQRGMFNSFGYEKKHQTADLYNMNNFVSIFTRNELINNNSNQNAVYFSMNRNNKTGESNINVKVKDIGLAIQIKRLVTLSKLVLLEDYIQPPKSEIVAVRGGKKEEVDQLMAINIELDNFVGCLGDRSFENYIVMQGLISIKLKFWSNKSQQQVLQLSKSFKTNGRFRDASSYQIQMRKYSLYFCNVNDPKNKRFLLLPINFFLILKQFYAKINQIVFLETQIDGMVDKINVECSVRDLLLVNKIIQDNLEALAAANKTKNSTIKSQIVVNQKKPNPQSPLKPPSLQPSPSLQQSYLLSPQPSFQQHNPRGTAVTRTIKPAPKIKSKTKATIKLESIQFRLVNNYGVNFIPVVRFIADESCLIYTGNLGKDHFIIVIGLSLDFFNPRSASWEPVIQGFQVGLDYKVIAAEYGSRSELVITSSQLQQQKQLKFNMSTQLLTILLTTLQILKKQKKSLSEHNKVPQIGQISPYIAQNRTNSIVTIYRGVENKEVGLDVKPLEKVKLRIGDSGAGEMLRFLYKGRIYQTSLEKFGYASLPRLKDLHLEFRIDKLNRIICFVEKITIKNATHSKLHCIRYNDKRQKMEQSIEMQSEMVIPVNQQWFIQFSFNMKTYTPPTKVSSLTKMYELIAQSQKFKLSIAQRPSILNHSVISIRAPFVICNCLPKNIKLQFISNSKHKSTSEIAAQSNHEVFANQKISNIRFKILIQGFYWSREFFIDFSKVQKKQNTRLMVDYIQLDDREKGITTIQYKFQIDQERCQYKLYLSCPAFIVSELEEDIHVYGNAKEDGLNKKIEKYFQLGGQSEYWKADDNEAKKEEYSNKRIDKVIIVGTEVGNKLRICGTNDCIVDFSQPFAINSIGVHQARVVVQRQIGAKKICVFTMLGVQIQLKKMTMRSNVLSKQITVRYRYIISNISDSVLFIKEEGSQKLCFHVQAGEKKPFYYTVPSIGIQARNMIVKSSDTAESLPLASNTLGINFFRLKLIKKPTNNPSKIDKKIEPEYVYFKLNTHQIKSYIFYEFSSVKYEDLPYQIEVRSSKFKVFVPSHQKVLVKNSQPFYFINQLPQYAYKVLLLINLIDTEQYQEIVLEADNVNFKETFQFASPFSTRRIVCDIHIQFNDSKKVVVIDQLTPQQSIPQHELQTISIKIQKLSISLIQNHSQQTRPYESFYLYLYNLQLILLKTNITSRYQVKLQFLQLDQQEPFNISDPVILTPEKYKRHTSKNVGDKLESVFNLLVEVDDRFVRNSFYNQVAIQVNNVVVRVTTYLIKLVLNMMKEYNEIFRTQSQFMIQKHINTWQSLQIPKDSNCTFIKNLKIAPFTVLITAFIRIDEQDIESAFLRTFLNTLGVVITDIDNAPIILDGILLDNCIDTFQGIQYKLVEHYKSSVIKQLYKILGSLNIIGNPVSLFRNIATGIQDLKEKPAEGFVKGPLEFGKGLADGTSSLIAHSIGGALNSVSKVTSTIATGMAVLTFDKQFQQARLKQKMQKPKHLFEGLESGGKAVIHGFKEGITGVVTKPIEQTKKSGALGLVKGVGKGIAGLIVKPVTGVVDFASKTTLGLKNTALYLQDKPNQNRIRYPRVFYTQSFIIRQYSQIDSKIMSIINRIKYEQKYGFENPIFISTFAINEEHYVVVLKEDVALVRIDNGTVEWAVPITGVVLTKEEGKVRIVSEKRREWYAKRVNALVEFKKNEDTDNFIKLVEELKVNMKDRTINQSYYL